MSRILYTSLRFLPFSIGAFGLQNIMIGGRVLMKLTSPNLCLVEDFLGRGKTVPGRIAGPSRDPVVKMDFRTDSTRMKERFLKYWLPAIMAMGFVFLLSCGVFSSRNSTALLRWAASFFLPSMSPMELYSVNYCCRKIAHLLGYFVLGLLLFRAFRGGSNSGFSWRWPFYALAVVVLWAAGDELHQSFLPTRTASLRDVGFDAVGGILAQFAGGFWHFLKLK